MDVSFLFSFSPVVNCLQARFYCRQRGLWRVRLLLTSMELEVPCMPLNAGACLLSGEHLMNLATLSAVQGKQPLLRLIYLENILVATVSTLFTSAFQIIVVAPVRNHCIAAMLDIYCLPPLFSAARTHFFKVSPTESVHCLGLHYLHVCICIICVSRMMH